ncbi:MAG: RecX family transcriptional regulator [Anaerolineae bacterium]|nr:RecX family transcriptional regulator [Anaerolineae bacterium]
MVESSANSNPPKIITALEVQKRNKERVNVYLDGEFAFGLGMVEAARLHKGQQLTESDIAALTTQDTVEQAYDRALRFLGARPRSSAEVRRSLAEKDTPPTMIDAVIARLEGQGYLDDVAFARMWVANRQQFKPRGSRALRFELREKGIATTIIDEVLAVFDAHEAAYQAAQDKARQLSKLDPRSFRDKLGAFLARRGFDYDAVREVTDRLLKEYKLTDRSLDDDE